MKDCKIYSFIDLFVEMVESYEKDIIKSKGLQKILLEVTEQVLEVEEKASKVTKLELNGNLIFENGLYFIFIENFGVVVVNNEDLKKVAELVESDKEENDG